MTPMAPAIPRFHVVAARFFSTHHASAADRIAAVARDFAPPAFSLLEGRARRFTSLVLQMHLEVCGPLHALAAAPPHAVFATRHGEIQTGEHLIADFGANAMVSSARFALSVHNTPSGLYSVASKNTAPTTTITGDNALAAGWLEAALTLAEGAPVLLSIADEPVPEALRGPRCVAGYAAAFLLAGEAAGAGAPGELFWAAAPGAANPSDDDAALAMARAVAAVDGGAATELALGASGAGTALSLRLGGARSSAGSKEPT